MQVPESLTILCDRAVRTSRCIDTRLGLNLALQAHRRARAEEEPKGILMATNAMAICQMGNGMHIFAMSTAIDAYRMGLALGERTGAANALLTLVSASHELFEIPSDESTQLLGRCLAEATALGDASLLVRTHNALGNNAVRYGHFAEGFVEFDRALAFVPQSDGTTPPGFIAGNVAHLAVRQVAAAPEEQRPALAPRAHALLDKALAMAVADRITGSELRAHLNRGRLHHVLGEQEEALRHYARALEMATRVNNTTRIADVNMDIAEAYTAVGSHAKAAAALETAYAVAEDIRPANQLKVICERLAEACQRAGDLGAAKRAREAAEKERAVYERERAHARREFEMILVSSAP
jgi:tetratricopeptide (TPR) repeat protein